MSGGQQYIPGTDDLKLTRTNEDLTIKAKGAYVFNGNALKTFTFEDGINEIVIFNEGTAKLNIAGNVDPNFAGFIFPGTPSMTFRWNKEANNYIF